MTGALPDGPLVAFYGDDFTGSSAVMEVLSFAGLPTVLFLKPPTPDDLAQFGGYRGIGVAGVSRSQSPEWMDRKLPQLFASLWELGAPILHYKICSTLDSSPSTGSIGRAIDLALPIVRSRPDAAKYVPLLVAAPPIGRHQAFGHLFANYAGANYRLDRHPVMRRHPTTPMDESDVALHLGKQTMQPIGLVDMDAIKSGRGGDVLDAQLAAGRSIVSLDVVDDETLVWAGREIWERRAGGLLAIGSQGVEYALVAHWRAAGVLAPAASVQAAARAEQVIVASGSVSPVTAAQIAWAAEQGFDVVAVKAETAVSEPDWRTELEHAVEKARQVLSAGRSVVLATAQGADDPAVGRLREAVAASGRSSEQVNRHIGEGLGQAVLRLIETTGLRRVALAGGDTSGFAARRLGIKALTALSPLAGGAPLCRAHSDLPLIAGLEIVLKGGQMGGTDFFGWVRAGRASE